MRESMMSEATVIDSTRAVLLWEPRRVAAPGTSASNSMVRCSRFLPADAVVRDHVADAVLPTTWGHPHRADPERQASYCAYKGQASHVSDLVAFFDELVHGLSCEPLRNADARGTGLAELLLWIAPPTI